jgi:class 3 adenylate cyclase
MAADVDLPLRVGVGVDVGEAVPVEGGFRGAALNTAARRCSKAEGGQVLVTSAVAARAADVEDVRYEPRGTAVLKGFEAPVRADRGGARAAATACLAHGNDPHDRPAAESALLELVADGNARRTPLGDDALWSPL